MFQHTVTYKHVIIIVIIIIIINQMELALPLRTAQLGIGPREKGWWITPELMEPVDF